MDEEIISLAEKRAEMFFVANRLATFKKWIFKNNKKCNSLKLAEAGFYFNGSDKEPDSVQCFMCRKCLDGWEEDDDPWEEHLKHAPYCHFAKLKCPEDKLTIQNLAEVQRALYKDIGAQMSDDTQNLMEKQKKKLLSLAARQNKLG